MDCKGDDKGFRLISTTGDGVVLTKKEIAHMGTLRKCFESQSACGDAGDGESEDLQEFATTFSTTVLERLRGACEVLVDTDTPPETDTSPEEEAPPVVDDNDDDDDKGTIQMVVDVCMLESLPHKELLDTLSATNFFDFKVLLTAAAKTVAGRLRGKTTEEQRLVLGVVDDFSPEERKELEAETAWVYENLVTPE